MPDPIAEFFNDAEVDAKTGSTSSVLAADATGKLYLCSNAGGIKVADVRPWLLNGPWAQNPPPDAPPALEWPIRHIIPQPTLPSPPSWVSISPNGCFALLSGCHRDSSGRYLWLLDLTSARPPMATATEDSATSAPRGRHEVCDVAVVDADLLEDHEGLELLQVVWHPHSNLHFGLLTSDNTWRLYNVQDVSIAEQTFELQLERRRRFGLLDGARAAHRVSSFAFGDGLGWERFAVYFCTADGMLSMLCPVAPFGARVAPTALAGLAAGLEGAAATTTGGWLQRAFPGASAALLRGTLDAAQLDGGHASGLTVQSHALTDHCPALQGPLTVRSPPGEDGTAATLMGLCEEDDAVVCMTVMRQQHVSVLCVGTLAGCIGLHVLAGTASPVWAPSPPQACSRGPLMRVRSQAPQTAHPSASSLVDAAAPPQGALLLLDVVDCGWVDHLDEMLQHGELGEGLGGGLPGTVQLLTDLKTPARVYVACPWAVCSIHLTWLPILAEVLRGGGDPQLPSLPPPRICSLMSVHPPNGPLRGAAVVGDALTGAAVVALSHGPSAPVPMVRWPTSGAPAAATPPSKTKPVEQDAAIEAMMQRVYGEILKGPSQQATLPPPPPTPLALDTPEAQAHLATAVDVLHRRHVEAAHRIAMDMGSRIKAVGKEDDVHEETEQRLVESATACTTAAQRLSTRLQRAVNLQRNLAARLTLLAELHMLAPAHMSAAERHARDMQLPALEDQTAQLKAEVGDLARRAIKLVQRPPPAHRAPLLSPVQQRAGLAPPAASQMSGDVSTPPRVVAGASRTFLTPVSSPFTRSTTFRTAAPSAPRWPSSSAAGEGAAAAVPPAQMKKMRDALTEAAQGTKALQQRLEQMCIALERHVAV